MCWMMGRIEKMQALEYVSLPEGFKILGVQEEEKGGTKKKKEGVGLKVKIKNPLLRRLSSCGIAGAISRTAVAPLETIRTHLMVGSCGHSTSEVFHNIMQADGWTGLFKGNFINVIRVAPGKAIEEFCNLSKHLTSRFIQKRLVFSVQSRFISVSPVIVPTNQQIAHLLLEQKTASQALQTFKWASEISNFTHTTSTYRALIHKLCTFRQFETIEQLLKEMPKSIGSGPDDDIFITMVRGYGRARMIREVTRVLDLLPKFGKAPSLKLLNSILDVLAKEDIDIAREFYRKKIMGSGLKGDDYTYGILMKGFCLTNRIGDGFKLLQVMKTHGVKINVVVYNTLIYALCKNGKVGRARSLMSEMEDYSDVTFNILISAYCNENNLVLALVLMEKCFDNGFLPDVVSVTKVVKVLCNTMRVLEAAEVLERVERKGGTLDVVAHNTLIEGFVRAGKVRAGLGFLKQMEMKGCLPNTDTYNILIAGFCETGMLDSALDMFHEMKRAGVKWDFATFETLIHGLCSNGRTREGLRIFELIEEGKGSFLGSINPYNSILYGLYRENLITEALEFLKNMRNLFPTAFHMSSRILCLCHDGHTVEAKKVFDEMTAAGRCPSALIHASLIQGFCEKGCIKEAVELVNQMIGLGYFPIASTFNGLINCLCEQRKSMRAMRLVEDLKMRGFLPDSESYDLLINAFCSEGEPQKALMLFLEMVGRDFTPDYNSWNVIIPAVSEFRDHKLLQQLTEI